MDYVTYDPDDDKLRVYFASRQPEEVLQPLKNAGFRGGCSVNVSRRLLTGDQLAELFSTLRRHIGAARDLTQYPDLRRDLAEAGRALTEVQSILQDVGTATEEYGRSGKRNER